jgi:hypothetical protein
VRFRAPLHHLQSINLKQNQENNNEENDNQAIKPLLSSLCFKKKYGMAGCHGSKYKPSFYVVAYSMKQAAELLLC